MACRLERVIALDRGAIMPGRDAPVALAQGRRQFASGLDYGERGTEVCAGADHRGGALGAGGGMMTGPIEPLAESTDADA